MDDEIKDLRTGAFFKKATDKIKEAEFELNKPGSDYIGYSVCRNAQFAIENFLKGYLVKNDIDIELSDTIASLYEKCIKVDERFKNIDINGFRCKNLAIASKHCTDYNVLSSCFDSVERIESFLKENKVF